MAALGGRVNGIICHANQGRERTCPMDVMSLLADMTAADSTLWSDANLFNPLGLFNKHSFDAK